MTLGLSTRGYVCPLPDEFLLAEVPAITGAAELEPGISGASVGESPVPSGTASELVPGLRGATQAQAPAAPGSPAIVAVGDLVPTIRRGGS